MATQKLILPINKMRVTAGYKNANYQQQFGFRHYGTDLTSTNSDRTVWGSGVGTVLLAGYDNVLGNVLVIRYDNCQLTTGATKNLIQRIFHLDRIDVKQGQSITKDTRIGLYGNTGKYTTGPHLHVEFDTDTSYPSYSPTISTSSNIIKAGTDSTVRPAEVMYVKNSAPDYQTVVGASNSNCWTNGDVMYPKYTESAPDGDVGASYYPKPNYIGASLVGALDAIGVDSSFDNREKIAKANGIIDYTGTATQNDSLFSLLMSGQLRRPGSAATSYYPVPNYTGTSLVGALNAIGVDSSFDNREKIAKANGIIDYAGTADQNNKLFNLLMSGQLKRPGTADGDNGSEDTGEGLTEIGRVPGLKVRGIFPPMNKYDIKCPYPMDPTYITVHNTYNQASAYNEITFMHNNNDEVSYHFAVDDQEAIQGLPLNRNGWHAGDGGQGTGNRKSIAVEICYSKYGGDKFDESEKNAAKLIAVLMEKFNIPIDRVRKHQDWSGKYCPHRTLDAGWDRFVDMIMKEVRKRKILKFASENGLLSGFDLELEDYHQKEKLLEVPGTLPGRPHIIVYGEVTLSQTITGILDLTASLNLSETPEKMADTVMELASQSNLDIGVSKEGLALTLSQVNMGKFNCDTLKLIVKPHKGTLNIIVEAEETKEIEHLSTTFCQKITITIHPDITSHGLIHVPIADLDVDPNTQEEFVDYLRMTNALTGMLALIVITGTVILTPADEIAAGIAAIKAFSLLIQKSK